MSEPKFSPPSDALVAIVITFLTPLFLGGPTGNHDLAAARAAAIEALASFRVRSAWDLLKVAQIVGFGMAAFGSLGLSLTSGLSVPMILRCRANADALQRTSERAEARLEKAQAQEADVAAPDLPPLDEAALEEAFRQAAEAQQAVAFARTRTQPPTPQADPATTATREPAAHPAPAQAEPAPARQPAAATAPARSMNAAAAMPPAAATLPPPVEAAARAPAASAPANAAAVLGAQRAAAERENEIVFATAMATVAAEFAQEMAHLPPAEQRLHQVRIAALNEVSQKLSRGEPLDASLLPGFPALCAGRHGPSRTT